MKDFSNKNRYALYDKVKIGDEKSKYKLIICAYSGNAGMFSFWLNVFATFMIFLNCK